MATKKKPQYYAYYIPETGDVTGITHWPEDNKHYIPIDYTLACNLFAGNGHYSNYAVSLVKKKGKQVLDMVEKQIINYAPRLRTFNRIYEGATNQELIVEWNLPNKEWVIHLNTSNVSNAGTKFIFYVVNEINFNQVVRTITVPLEDLIETKSIPVKFESSIEENIDNLVVISKLVLGSYGLRIKHD